MGFAPPSQNTLLRVQIIFEDGGAHDSRKTGRFMFQVCMIQMAKTEVPVIPKKKQVIIRASFCFFTKRKLTSLQERRKRKSRFANSDSESDEDDGDLKAADEEKKKKLTDTSPGTAARAPAQSAVPPGPPPGLPPGLPPGK